MSKFKGIVGLVSSLFKSPDVPKMPKAVVPPTAPHANAGANIVLGTPMDTTRVSGSGSSTKKVDPLGFLGLGGLSI